MVRYAYAVLGIGFLVVLGGAYLLLEKKAAETAEEPAPAPTSTPAASGTENGTMEKY